MTFLACAILLPGLVFASPQPKPINDAQRDAIMRAIRAGMHSYRELENARAKEKTLREDPSTDQDLTALQNWNDWNRKIADQKRYMEYHFNYAIELAREHYGICWPQCDSGAVKNGPFKGLDSRFKPVFKEPFFLDPEQKVEYRAVKAPDGSVHYLAAPLEGAFKRRVTGSVWDDGEVAIRADLFARAERFDNPGVLGSVLYHEQVHHEELVKEGWTSIEETELHAYTAQFKAAGVFKTPREDREYVRTHMAINARKLLAARKNPDLLTKPFVTPESEDVNRGFLEGAQSRLDDIRLRQARLKASLEAAEGRRQEEERLRRERENPPAIPLVAMKDIRELVVARCGGAPWLAETYLHRIRSTIWVPEGDGYAPGMENGMDDCARELWELFMRGRAKIIETGNIPAFDPAWFDEWFDKAWQRAYAYHHPPLGFPTFMLLAKKACANPGSVTQADVKDLEEMSFPNPRLRLGTADSFPSHVWSDRCSKDLYDALARINRTEPRGFRLNVAWVNWQAEQFVRRDQPAEAPRQTPRQEVEPEQRRNDRIDLPTLEDILGRLGGR